jgi:hypothetical protein
MASPQSSSRRLTVTMGIKAHPPATLSPVSRRARRTRRRSAHTRLWAHEHVRDCWKACAALGDDDPIAAVCADLCVSVKRAHSLRHHLTPARGADAVERDACAPPVGTIRERR